MAVVKLNNVDDETDAWLGRKAKALSARSKRSVSKNQFAELLLKKCMIDDLTHLSVADKNSNIMNEKLDGLIEAVNILAHLFLYDGEADPEEGDEID